MILQKPPSTISSQSANLVDIPKQMDNENETTFGAVKCDPNNI